MAYTYDISMFQETFESEFNWLNGFMRNVRRFGYRAAAIFPAVTARVLVSLFTTS